MSRGPVGATQFGVAGHGARFCDGDLIEDAEHVCFVTLDVLQAALSPDGFEWNGSIATVSPDGVMRVAYNAGVLVGGRGRLPHRRRKRDLPMGDFVWNDAEAGVPQWTATTLAHWGVLMFAEELGESASPAISQDVVNLDEVDILEAAF